MQTKYFWWFAIAVTAGLEEALRTGLVPAQYAHIAASLATFLGFLIRKQTAGDREATADARAAEGK